MINAWNNFWSFFASLFSGANQYAEAFEKSGVMVNSAMDRYEKEIQLEHEKEMEKLEKDLKLVQSK